MTLDTYDALLEGIDEIFASGKDLSSQARGRRLAHGYWQIGDAIHHHLLAHVDKSTYGEGLMKRLSNDLSLDIAFIYLMVRFRRGMPNVGTFPHLSWSHYIPIIPLESQQQREFYERVASSEAWTVRELKQQIKSDLFADARQLGSAAYRTDFETAARTLAPRKGRLYTYRLIRALSGQAAAGEYLVDLGFYNQWPGRLEGIEDPKDGMIVTSTRKSRSASTPFRFTVNRERGRKLYTVVALPERIIDGDTILARIDQGFDTWRTERLRLRGIDTPELYSTAGQHARNFVHEELEQVEFVIICTGSRDRYGRYLTDLFYLPGSDDPTEVLTDGIFLNRRLLDQDHARPY